jgi:hypothetical protein
MNNGSMAQPPPPTRATPRPFAKQVAAFSLLAPLIAVAFETLTPVPPQREAKIIAGGIGIFIILAGLILGIVVLAGTRKHGRRGIMGLALAGTIVNGVLLLAGRAGVIRLMPAPDRVATVVKAGYTPVEMEEMPRVIPDSRVVIDGALGFRIEIPREFRDNPQPSLQTLYSFARVDANGLSIGIHIDWLGRRLPKGPLGPDEIAIARNEFHSGSEVEHTALPWKTHQLDAFITRIHMKRSTLCQCTVQVPLARGAIQVNVTGPAELKQECRDLLAFLLTGLKGLSNWDPLPVLQEHVEIRQGPRWRGRQRQTPETIFLRIQTGDASRRP